MKRFFIFVFMFFSFILFAQEENFDLSPEIGGRSAVVVEEGDTVTQDIAGDDMDIIVKGVLNGDIALMKGYLHVFPGGVINGDIALVMTDADIDSGSVVNGDIADVMGDVKINDKAIINGDRASVFLGKNMEQLFSLVRRKNFISIPYASFISILFVGFLVVLISPIMIKESIKNMRERTGRSVLWGVLIVLTFVPLLLTLILTIVGIAAIPLLILFYIVLYFIAMTIGGVYLGGMFFNKNYDRNLYLLLFVGLLIPFAFGMAADFLPGIAGGILEMVEILLYSGFFIMGTGGFIEFLINSRKK